MLILTAYKSVLTAAPSVMSRVKGGLHIARVAQNAARPNVLLEMVESGQDYTHSGPVGLFDAHIRITARADTDEAAFLLADAIARVLQDWRGDAKGCRVQMSEHFGSTSTYDSASQCFMQTEEFTSFFTRLS